MNLTELQREAHAIAKDHGWWDEERTFGDCSAEIHSELSAALGAYRELGATKTAYTVDAVGALTKPEGVPYELADVVIRVADMAEWYEVDLASTFESLSEGASDRDMSANSFGDWISVCHATFSLAFAVREYDFPAETWQEHLSEGCQAVQRMAAHYGIDLDAAIEAKMEYYRSRSYRHGGEAL